MKSKVITLLFCHKFSLLPEREDFTGSLRWYFFRINLGSTNQKIRDPSLGPEDYQFESLDKLWNVDREEEKHFFILREKVPFKEWPQARHLTLIFSTRVPVVKVCSVFGAPWYDWIEIASVPQEVYPQKTLYLLIKAFKKWDFLNLGKQTRWHLSIPCSKI